jgi:predicted nuclease of restriction endonuclease-like RecB superfamily
MLTADLVDARRKDGELHLRKLDAEGRAEALAISAALLETARAFVGKRREELDEAWDAATNDATTKRFKVAAGLRKLIADECSFEAEISTDPSELRRVLFTLASEVRRSRGEGERFERAGVVEEAAKRLAIAPDVLERSMFADLRSEHLLVAPPSLDAASLVEAWVLGQAQAVLLTAVRITCEISSSSPGLVRSFFAKLKFHRLLFSAERITLDDREAWRVVIDGPYSMFDAVTKYGVKLAIALPALRALEHWSLVADIRWGKGREPLTFRLSNDPTEASSSAGRDDLHLADEVRELLDAINATKSGGWSARVANVLLDVPGAGICIPDLELTRKGDPEPVYVEVLGFWSRDAVFRRVELAERGLGARVVFALSSRLRVSAEVLDENVPSSLYVYKGKMSPRAVLDHAAKLATGASATRR